MKSKKSLYHRHRFPKDIIRHTVWLYYRFCLSYRDDEDLMAERGVAVSFETIRRWCLRFGPVYANRLRNLFAISRHLMRAKHHRMFRTWAVTQYEQVACA